MVDSGVLDLDWQCSVGSISSMGMGISPKDTVSKDPRGSDPNIDPASKQ